MPKPVWKAKKFPDLFKSEKAIMGAIMEATSPKIANAFMKQVVGGKAQLNKFVMSLAENTKAGQAVAKTKNLEAIKLVMKQEAEKFEFWIECPSDKKAVLYAKNGDGVTIILDSVG